MAIALPTRREHALGGESVSVERILEQRDVRTWFATLLESVRLTPHERTLELATTVFSHLASNKLSGWHLYLARIGRPANRNLRPAPGQHRRTLLGRHDPSGALRRRGSIGGSAIAAE